MIKIIGTACVRKLIISITKLESIVVVLWQIVSALMSEKPIRYSGAKPPYSRKMVGECIIISIVVSSSLCFFSIYEYCGRFHM